MPQGHLSEYGGLAEALAKKKTATVDRWPVRVAAVLALVSAVLVRGEKERKGKAREGEERKAEVTKRRAASAPHSRKKARATPSDHT